MGVEDRAPGSTPSMSMTMTGMPPSSPGVMRTSSGSGAPISGDDLTHLAGTLHTLRRSMTDDSGKD
jgi:hypothetical protein